jgi:hypothetical protein
MSEREISDGFARFVQAVGESPILLAWFCKLESVSERDRSAALLKMSADIRAEDEDLALTALKLRDSKLYTAVLSAVRERTGQAGALTSARNFDRR